MKSVASMDFILSDRIFNSQLSALQLLFNRWMSVIAPVRAKRKIACMQVEFHALNKLIKTKAAAPFCATQRVRRAIASKLSLVESADMTSVPL